MRLKTRKMVLVGGAMVLSSLNALAARMGLA